MAQSLQSGRRPQNAPQLFCPPSHACLVSVCEQIPLSFLGYLVRLTVHLSSIHKRFGSLCEVSRLPVLRRSLGQCFGSQCEPSALAGPEGASALLHRPASQRTSAQFPGGGRAQAQSRPRRGKVAWRRPGTEEDASGPPLATLSARRPAPRGLPENVVWQRGCTVQSPGRGARNCFGPKADFLAA